MTKATLETIKAAVAAQVTDLVTRNVNEVASSHDEDDIWENYLVGYVETEIAKFRGKYKVGASKALVEACRWGRWKEVAGLLAGGADPSARHASGVTPLHCAAAQGSLEAVKRLVAAGADVRAVTPARPDLDVAAQTVLEAAGKNREIVKYLASVIKTIA